MAAGLATRCGACGTVFRVVPDQLRVSEGWVRCGRCSEVFNAAEALLDLETGAQRRLPAELLQREPPPAPPPAPPPPPAAPVHAPPAGELYLRASAADRADADADGGTQATMPVIDDPASRFATLADEDSHPADPDPHADADDRPAPPAAQPSFIRQAERAAHWRRPRVRAVLATAALLALLALAAQGVFEYRDIAAARYPGLRPLLEAGCGMLNCSVGPARSINELTVESSGLLRVEKSSIYKLSVALRNRATIELALPALELSLTDSQGQLVARRVLAAAELGAGPATLPAGREVALQATLQTSTAPVAGYTIELFYP